MSLQAIASSANWEEVDSSNINRIAFDEETASILVEFKDGQQFAYDDCSPRLYEQFKNAESVGKFFYKNIKPKAYERLN